MGAVFRPKGFTSVQRNIIENALKDLTPDTSTRDNIIELLNSWEGLTSKKKLEKILGQKKTEKFLGRIIKADEAKMMTSDEEKRLRNMFKESLTFD
jgi:hypothetical protein